MYLHARTAESGAIIIHSQIGGKLKLLGASCSANRDADHSGGMDTRVGWHEDITIFPEIGDIVAICEYRPDPKRSYAECIQYRLYKVILKDGAPFLDLNPKTGLFVCDPARRGCIVGESIEVQIDGQLYGNDPGRTKKDPNYHFVPNGNLLCRYLVNKATPDEVKGGVKSILGASETKSPIASDRPDLAKRIKELEVELADAKVKLRKASILAEENAKLRTDLTEMCNSLRTLTECWFLKWIFRRRDVRRIIRTAQPGE